MINVVHIN